MNKKISQPHDYRFIIFDLGFVLVELKGFPWFKKNYPNLSEAEIHNRWIALDCVQKFETGKISAQDFFSQAVKELNLSEKPDEFAKHYKAWVAGPYPGVEALLLALKKNYGLACLSNTNGFHINHLNEISSFLSLLDHRFYSHEIGLMKPDARIYQQVIQALNVPSEKILFIDDSKVNVDAAIHEGISAFQAKGFEQVLDCLKTQINFEM